MSKTLFFFFFFFDLYVSLENTNTPTSKRYLKPARQETIMSLQHRLPDHVPAPRERQAVLPTIFNGK